MTSLLIVRVGIAWLSAILLGTVIGCSKTRDEKPMPDDPLVNLPADEDGKNTSGEIPMAKQPKHDFQEYVKNPDLFREETQELDRADSAPPPTERELAALVSTIGQRRLEYHELQQLRKAGDKVVPPLLTALQDEEFLFRRYGESGLDGSAIEISLDLLEPFALPKTSLLEPALRHPDESIRKRALYHLARCGNDDAIDALVAGLKSPSEDCRSYTLSGLEFLRRSSRGSKKFRDALFQASLPLLTDTEYNIAEHAPRALLVLDPPRAKSVLLGENVFSPKNENLYKVLQSLKDASVPVPGPQLRKLLAGIKAKPVDFPFDNAYGEGLILLARAESEKARDLIDDAEKWGNKIVCRRAAEALTIAAGVENAYEFVIDLCERRDVKGLTEPQLYYLALWRLDAQVRNGGFSQYYFNFSGDLAIHAVKAARSVGASELAAIIEKANGLFGKKGPDPHRDRRMDQLSKIDLKVLKELDTCYYDCKEQLSEILPKFVVANAKHFKADK